MMDNNMRSKEELNKCLKDRLKEELSDVLTYGSLYESYKAQGMYEEASDMESIAHKEFEHAELIHDILLEHGHDSDIDAEIASLWQKAKEAFHIA